MELSQMEESKRKGTVWCKSALEACLFVCLFVGCTSCAQEFLLALRSGITPDKYQTNCTGSLFWVLYFCILPVILPPEDSVPGLQVTLVLPTAVEEENSDSGGLAGRSKRFCSLISELSDWLHSSPRA